MSEQYCRHDPLDECLCYGVCDSCIKNCDAPIEVNHPNLIGNKDRPCKICGCTAFELEGAN